MNFPSFYLELMVFPGFENFTQHFHSQKNGISLLKCRFKFYINLN